MAGRNRNSGQRATGPAKGLRSEKDMERPGELQDAAPEDGFPEPEVQLAEAEDLEAGGRDPRESFETDGPVMGGPGMMRTGGDRAVSTGTGGLAAGEDLDPVAEGDYWRENFRRRPYYEAEREFSHYEPAYRYGWERAGLSEYRNRSFEEIEIDLRRGWESAEQAPLPSWEHARHPARDAFERARDRKPSEKNRRHRMDRDKNREDANRDPLTGEPGSHPVATGVGAAGAAAAGAAVGAAVGGPVGAVVGGAVGAVAGGAAGHAAGEAIDPTRETAYWRENFRNRPYYQRDKSFDDYEPAYRYGWESATRPDYKGRRFDEVESDLERGWDKTKGTTKKAWYEVREATRDAFDRVRS